MSDIVIDARYDITGHRGILVLSVENFDENLFNTDKNLSQRYGSGQRLLILIYIYI